MSDRLFLTKQEVLTRWGISTSTLQRMVRRGTFPAPIELTPRKKVWDPADLEAKLAELKGGKGRAA